MKRLNNSSDVPEARRGILPKTYTSSKTTTRLRSTFPRRNGVLSAASTKEPGGKRVCGRFRSEYACGQQRDVRSAELDTMRISKYPMMVMTTNGEVQTREEPWYMSKNWIYS